MATGGKFWAGFAAGAFSSIAASVWQGGSSLNPDGTEIAGSGMKGIGGKFADTVTGTLSFGAVMGGAGSAIGGGNFWQGAVTGLIVAEFNHLLHQQKLSKKFADGTKEYLAIVTGESSDNILEAEGIGDTMLNRLKDQGAVLEEGFVDKIGGAGDFDAIGGRDYNNIMKMSLKQILNIKQGESYYLRIQGGLNALNKSVAGLLGISNGAYFWNASSPKTGFNWRMVNNKTFTITAELGKTTFFKYSNPNKQWP